MACKSVAEPVDSIDFAVSRRNGTGVTMSQSDMRRDVAGTFKDEKRVDVREESTETVVEHPRSRIRLLVEGLDLQDPNRNVNCVPFFPQYSKAVCCHEPCFQQCGKTFLLRPKAQGYRCDCSRPQILLPWNQRIVCVVETCACRSSGAKWCRDA